jgi:hypothetical protein
MERAFTPMRERMKALEAALASIPTPQIGPKGEVGSSGERGPAG